MKAPINTTVQLLRHFGPGWLMFRLGYAFRQRAGVLRRTLPATSWEEQPLARFLRSPLQSVERFAESRGEGAARFLFDVDAVDQVRPCFERWDAAGQSPVATADALEAGVFRFFEHLDIHLGCPPDWHHNPVTGDAFPRDRHWTQIGDFAAGDIKLVWEPNRFAWVYPLVRAWWRTGDERYPRLFWQLLEDWRAANSPQQGVNWKCGQEVAIRLMAVCFGRYGFAGSVASTPQRIADVAQLLAVSATRIEANLSYALSQQNNHGITEAVGLWTVGLLFPEFQRADHWKRVGRAAIEQQCQSLIDDDGAFSQHSVNYQRVMLDACLWAIRLGQRNDQPLSSECLERVQRSAEFLWQLQDEATGRLPRYGQNDGALLLPLTNCGADDYRPVLQAAAVCAGDRRYDQGPWDEAAFWLTGAVPNAVEQAEGKPSAGQQAERCDWYAAAGGYQVLRGAQGHLVTRAPRYRYRPAHADALHVDLWWRGINIAQDAGTYSYNAPPPWNNPLAGTAAHNTVMVDRRDQMERAGRFLWLPWLRGERTAYATSDDRQLTCWEGTHNGYQQLPAPVQHRRGILRIGEEHWLVIDDLRGEQSHEYRLHWLLADLPCELDEPRGVLQLSTDAGTYRVVVGCSVPGGRLSLARADDASPRGWCAPHYTDRQPALSLALEVSAPTLRFVTLLGPQAEMLRVEPHQVQLAIGAEPLTVPLASDGVMIDPTSVAGWSD